MDDTQNTGEEVDAGTNMHNSMALRRELVSLRMPLFDVQGIYEGVTEDSYCVVNKSNSNYFRNKIIELGKKYCQDSVLIVPAGGKSAYLYGTNKAE